MACGAALLIGVASAIATPLPGATLRGVPAPQRETARSSLMRLSGGASGKTILVTGGVGYIGSHTVLEMLTEGYEVTVMDNLHNATKDSLNRVMKLTGKTVEFVECDLLDMPGMEAIFKATKYDAVIHFAGLKAVGESMAKVRPPLT